MTMLKEYMTTAQIAIAEACGWTDIKQGADRHPCMQQEIDYGPTGVRPDGQAECYLPNPFDLNAMHAALKVQTQIFRAEFDRMLHAMAEEKHLLVIELEAKDWADCFISCLQSTHSR
jgi:hypothetical protein